MFNLSFCDTTAYAVPSNPERFSNASSLAAFYDNATQEAYGNFEKALAQVACETTDSAQYSLVKNCDDCAAAYKDWLCSVSIPRCTDFSSNLPWLQERNMLQAFPNGTGLEATVVRSTARNVGQKASRNPAIDQTVAPGPYKEIMPCDDVCYSVVRSCPATIQFTCPQPGDMGFESSYGVRPDAQQQMGGNLTCNFPGAMFLQSAAAAVRGHVAMVLVVLGLLLALG